MPVPLRTDFDANALRAIARKTKDGPQARRLLALAAIYDGATRTEAARIGGVTVQIVRDWVVKFNAHGPEGLINRKPPGQPSKLTDAHRAALQAIIEQGPIPAVHGVVRGRLIDLIQWLWEEFRLSLSKQTLSRELRAMNYRKLSARPRHHAKSEAAVAAFKKTSRPAWRRSGRRSAASRSRSGSPRRPGSGRRTRSPGAGPNAARGLQPPRTSERRRLTSSARSVRLRAKARAWFCPAARPRA
jgi:transposase